MSDFVDNHSIFFKIYNNQHIIKKKNILILIKSLYFIKNSFLCVGITKLFICIFFSSSTYYHYL